MIGPIGDKYCALNTMRHCQYGTPGPAYQIIDSLALTIVSRALITDAALERLLDRLLEEYIEEIEKMAEIVAQEGYMSEEVTPIELQMSDSHVPVTVQTGFMADAKDWMAGRFTFQKILITDSPHRLQYSSYRLKGDI
ncbi:hypothetical protein DICVIV_08050 [Dictyocaulus viviparus]|uniref:Uncharacterized protein n=1 Tax=Dictyocaulus viviparus TaxID=29172 RepID=A0A0D8XMY6_DICVI|nr:hypothetical protein DICVIV_08050 [Dictyocaulus viviparus]